MLSPGDQIGPYEIVALLGAGGMGQVYRARDTKLDRMVAIKVLPDGLMQDAERCSRFRREAKILAALNHPNIAAIYGWDESGGAPALVMELVAGRPLDELIPRNGMQLDAALKCAIQIARGLEAAHRAGVVHRDLKPSNVMMTASGVAKLLDFGLAKQDAREVGPADETVSATRTAEGAIVGTVAYMSPEQAQGKPIDARSDLFSFGTLLFQMLTGERAFHGGNQVATLAAILREEAKPVSSITPVPHEVDRLVARCLRKDLDRRFQTASDLRAALEDLAEEASSGQLEKPAIAPRRSRSWWPAAVVALAAIAAAGLYWLRPQRGATPSVLRQVTFESGMAIMPALSPDGKLLAYASDRAGQGALDLWIRQTAAGDPHRLTTGMGGVSNPQFSPDGTRVLFLSGSSIFEISALGGQPRLLIENAGPFTISSRGEIAYVLPRTGITQPIRIVPVEGGESRELRSDCRAAAAPGWAPDGQRLAFVGTCGKDQGIYVVPRQGGAAFKIPLASGGKSMTSSVQWYRSAGGSTREALIIPARNGDSVNLFRVGLDGAVSPITQGTGWESGAAVSGNGEVVFARAEYLPTVWSVPLEGAAAPRKEAAPATLFGVARDGSRLVFGRTAGMTKGELVARDIGSGTETVIASHTVTPGGIGSFWTQISPDGSQAVYRLVPGPFKINQCLVSLTGGAPRCLETMTRFSLASGWRADGKRIVGECEQGAICEMDPGDFSVRPIVHKMRDTDLLFPSYSWDGKWMTFMQRGGGVTAIAMARVRGDGSLAPQSEWVRVSPADVKAASRARFTEDGKTIFYIRNEGGIQHLVRQPVDLVAGRAGPAGADVASVQVFAAWFADSIGAPSSTVDVSKQRVYFNSVEVRGNVWTMSLP